MAYVQGFLLAVPEKNREAYREMAEAVWPMFEEYGCIGFQENWGVDVPDGKVTSFPMSVKLEEGEVVVFSWMLWPDRKTCDEGMKKMMEDPRMKDAPQPMPFDGMRMMWGGFEPLVSRGETP